MGWRYREKYKDKTKISCVDGDVPILGFTKKNSVWLSHEVAGWNMPELSALVDTGYMCFDVCGKQDDPSSQRWYCLKNSTDYPKFVAKVQELSKKRGITAVVYPMSEYISQEKERNNKIFLNLVKYAWKVMLIAIMLIMVIKVYSFWKDRRMYGVFYISGMTTSRIGGSIWLENILLFFCAFAIACIVLWNGCAFMARIDKGSYGALEGIVQALLVSKVFKGEFAIVLICCCVTSVIPMSIFSHMMPVNMIRNSES